MSLVNVTNLQRAAEKYNLTLQTLPFMILEEMLTALDINQMEVAAKDILMQFQRKAGLARPYTSNTTLGYAGEIGKIIEIPLEVKTSYAALKEHIQAYKDSKLILNSVEDQKVDNQLKKHPLEVQIIGAKLKTICEDIIDYLFYGERDDSGLTPVDMFDGFYTQIAAKIISGEIAADQGNLVTTGALSAPASGTDTDAWDALVGFIRSAHPSLRKNAVLYITGDALFNAMDALKNAISYKNVMAFDDFVRELNGFTKSNIRIISETSLGTGSRLMLSVPRNLDFGMNTKSDVDFCQVRTPFEDPNLVQFWTQWDAGCRVRSIHKKEFQVNEQTSTALELSGDYTS
jgi:hypothetical protein